MMVVVMIIIALYVYNKIKRERDAEHYMRRIALAREREKKHICQSNHVFKEQLKQLE